MWDRHRIVAEIRALERGGRSLASSKAPPALVRAGARVFGGWGAAITAAGIAYDHVRLQHAPFDEASMLRELIARTRAGVPLGAVGQACRRRFGSLNAAREAAGLQVLTRRWSKSTIVAAIRALAGSSISSAGDAFRAACRHHFGSVAAAYKAARAQPAHRTWSPDVIVRALRAWSRRRGPMPEDLPRAAKRHFGSLNAACIAARVEPPRKRWSRMRVREELRAVADAGRKAESKLVQAAFRYYGSLTAARRAARLRMVR